MISQTFSATTISMFWILISFIVMLNKWKWLIYTDIRRFTWPDNNIDLRNPELECLYLFYIWHFCAVYSGYAGKTKYADDVDV